MRGRIARLAEPILGEVGRGTGLEASVVEESETTHTGRAGGGGATALGTEAESVTLPAEALISVEA